MVGIMGYWDRLSARPGDAPELKVSIEDGLIGGSSRGACIAAQGRTASARGLVVSSGGAFSAPAR